MKKWFLCMRHSIRPRAEWTVTLNEHLAWMRERHEDGSIFLSGPTPDRTVGLYLIRAASQEEAQQIADSDPYTAAGFCHAELLEWQVSQIAGIGPFERDALRH